MINFSNSLEDFRRHVPVAGQCAYLITASTGLIPDFIYDGVRRYHEERYRKGGDSTWLYEDGIVGTLEMMERSKAAIGEMIGCSSAQIAFGQSATQMFTMVTEGIDYDPGANVVTVGEGWIGNRFAWQKRESEGLEVRYVKAENGVITAEDLINQCDEHTAAVTVNLVESNTGYRVDIDKLGTFCTEHGILLFVDAVQAAGALSIDVKKSKIDFLVGNDYKWMMNFCGTGYAYIGPKVEPLIRHWGAGWMSDQDRFDTSKSHLQLRQDAGKFEIGYPHADGIYGLGLAAMQYNLLGKEQIETYVCSLAEECQKQAESIPGIHCTYNMPQEKRCQILLLSLEKSLSVSDEDFKKARVVVPAMEEKNSSGDRTMRLSFHYYNNREDIERFFSVIRQAVMK